MITEIVEKCVNLANVMTAEQAFYQCCIVCAGDGPADANVRTGQSGRVLMCTFPGLGRKVHSNGKIAIVSLVKPCVELESIIRPREKASN